MMIMAFSIKLVNNKVVDYLRIYMVFNFYSHRPYGLRIIAARSLLSEILVLWIDLKDGIVWPR